MNPFLRIVELLPSFPKTKDSSKLPPGVIIRTQKMLSCPLDSLEGATPTETCQKAHQAEVL